MLDSAAAAAAFEKTLTGINAENTDTAPAALAKDFHNYIKGGTLLGGNLAAGGAEPLLVSAFTAPTTPAALAQGICDFLATCITPGTPGHGGTAVVSVVINAQAMAAAMAAAVQGCITDQAQATPYKIFFDALQDVIKTVPCIITELITTPSGPVPTAFPETIN